MSEHEEMTPKRLRTMASVYRDPEDRHLVRLDTDCITADILDGLAVLWERGLAYEDKNGLGPMHWSISLAGVLWPRQLGPANPTPVAALVALGREARSGHAVTVHKSAEEQSDA
jgi:hypothetical protein